MLPPWTIQIKKEGVSRTNKGFDGNTLMMAYIGMEGYAINFGPAKESNIAERHCSIHLGDGRDVPQADK